MNRVLKLLPLVVIPTYLTLGGIAHYRLEFLRSTSLAACLILLPAVWYLMRSGRASAIEKSFLAFAVASVIGLWALPGQFAEILGRRSVAFLYAVLFLAAAGPLVLGREPFTTFFARKTAPQAVWETDVFERINVIMTAAWAGIFGVCAICAMIPALVGKSGSTPWIIMFEVAGPMIFLLGVGLPFTKKYPDYHLNKQGLPPLKPAAAEPAPATANAQPNGTIVNRKARTMEVIVSDKPKVVAINGSPHEGAANTSQMIGMIQHNLEKEGFELEQILLTQHNIHYCYGCAVCLEKGSCWIKDDYKGIMEKVLAADAVILGCPVYVLNVTAQMKTFLDRSLGFGHRPRDSWKPGLSVCVSAGLEEVAVSQYLSRILRIFGAFSIGEFTAIAVGPGQFLGKDAVEARAKDLAGDLVRAVREKRRYPANSDDREFWQFMGWLVHENRDLMKADHEHWEKAGLYDSFEKYVGQERDAGLGNPDMRQNWIKGLMKGHAEKTRGTSPKEERKGPKTAASARELLEMMPLGLKPEAADGMSAVYQFEISGGEEFEGYLVIENKTATFCEGRANNPSVTIKTPADIWMSIARGELDGAQAFMSGKYKVEGDVSLLMKMQSLFDRG